MHSRSNSRPHRALKLGSGLALALLAFTGEALAAPMQVPEVGRKLLITDGVSTKGLVFGMDPCATDGFDPCMGEASLPPLPPLGAFDVRFIGFDIGIPLELGSFTDVRNGDSTTYGLVTHELSLQLGLGSIWTLSWDLQNGTTAVLQDLFGGLVFQEDMIGEGQVQITNPALNRLLMLVTYAEPDPFFSPTHEISLAAGGSQDLTLDAGPAHAGDLYLVLGSATGTTPGTPLGGGLILPLNFDGYSLHTINHANQPPFVNTLGNLDAAGIAQAQIVLPPATDPSLAGVTVHHAFGTQGAGGTFVSNAVSLTLTP